MSPRRKVNPDGPPRGVGIERSQLAAIGLINGLADLASKPGDLGLVVPLLEQTKGLIDHGLLRGIQSGFDERPDELLAIGGQLDRHGTASSHPTS